MLFTSKAPSCAKPMLVLVLQVARPLRMVARLLSPKHQQLHLINQEESTTLSKRPAWLD
jgi:hypothetical protein